jgi:[ribosomal protein S5]-alanine N-acetyltransferase
LQTRRLHLRPLVASDAPRLFEIFSDPRVMRYWSTPPWADIAEAHAAIERDAVARRTGGHVRLGIERTSDGRLLGTCALFDLERNCRRAEIGYALGADAWGQGYVQEALGALLDAAFDELHLNRIEADIDPRNLASARSLQRLGFVQEGLLRQRWIVDGEISDSALYGLLRADWQARRLGQRAGSSGLDFSA